MKMTAGRNAHRRVTWLVLVPALALMTGVVPARADTQNGWTRTVTKSYVGSDLAPWPGAGVCSHDDDGPSVGVVCLGRTVGDVVTLKVYDDSGLPVGGLARISDGYGGVLYRREFCGTSGPIPAVPGLLTVYLRAQSGYSLTCPSKVSAVATKGRVHATFTAAD